MTLPETSTTIIYGGLLAALLLLLYFGFLRPDSKAKKIKQTVQENIQVGDKVFTKAGIYGTVTAVNGELLTLDVAETHTVLEVARWGIRSVEGKMAQNPAARTLPLNHGDEE